MVPGPYSQHFASLLTNGPNMIESYFALGWKGLLIFYDKNDVILQIFFSSFNLSIVLKINFSSLKTTLLMKNDLNDI
jgi:hypothetical protein